MNKAVSSETSVILHLSTRLLEFSETPLSEPEISQECRSVFTVRTTVSFSRSTPLKTSSYLQ